MLSFPDFEVFMMRSRLFVLFTVLAAVSTSAFAQATASDSSRGYLVGPGDEITGKVLGETQFDFVATVDENGNIEVPFFDKPIGARCRTESELRTDVTKLLTKYLKNPGLSLRVTKRNSRPPVTVGGEVRKQQQVDLTRRATLLELISFSGGETEKSGGIAQVFRTKPPICAGPNDPNAWSASSGASASDVPFRQFSLTELRKGSADANPEIVPGDIIVVQKASPVYIIGEVTKPGELGIPEGGLVLTQAIAMASGVSRGAKTKDVKIYRQKSGVPDPEVLAINYDEIRKGIQKDIQLLPNDIVEVGKASKKFTDYLLEFAVGVPNRIPLGF